MPTDDASCGRTAVPVPNRHEGFAHKPWLWALVLVIATFAAYQSVWHAGFVWDDDEYVTNNPVLRSWGGLAAVWLKPGATKQYYPLVFTSLWAEYHLWKLQPLGYHLVNVLLHGLNAVLLWFVLRRLKIPGSWWAAAIFALHPVCVESVAWITELKNIQSGMFFFLSILCFLRFRPLTDREAARACDWRYYPLVLGLFACALLSKTATCSLPAVLVLLIWWKAGRVERRDVVPLAPLFVLAAVLGLVTHRMELRAGAVGAEWSLSFTQRCLLAGRALWFYAAKLFWPAQLTFVYPRWEVDSESLLSWMPLAGLIVVGTVLWARRRQGWARAGLFACGYFVAALLPVLGFFDVFYFRYSFVADHFQYLASVGLIAVIANGGAEVGDRLGRPGRQMGVVVVAVTLLSLGALTWRQGHIYHDVETLWQDTLTKNPQCWMAHNNWGIELEKSGKRDEAIGHYEQAVRINPDDAEACNNLGNIYFDGGNFSEAISYYEQALIIKPDYAEVHINLGNALRKTGRIEEAIAHYRQALRIGPNLVEAHCNLGIALEKAGRLPEAIQQYEQVLRIKPNYAEAHAYLGNALAQMGRVPEAMAQYEQALRIKPNYAPARSALARLQARQ
jgi:tetratricopeptide (TPR) repeat protein